MNSTQKIIDFMLDYKNVNEGKWNINHQALSHGLVTQDIEDIVSKEVTSNQQGDAQWERKPG